MEESMTTIDVILAKKGNQVWSIEPSAQVYAPLELMAEKNVGALLVLDGQKIVGIMSERDYARKVMLKGKSSKSTPVSEIMTAEVLYVTPSHSVEECLALMTNKKIRHLPVLENDELVGIISIGDVVIEMISEKELLIEQLENYIKGY